MPNSSDEHLEQLRTWRDNLVTALATPETTSAFGGMPDANMPNGIGRMSGRAQLMRELEVVEKKIEDAQGNEPYLAESRGVT